MLRCKVRATGAALRVSQVLLDQRVGGAESLAAALADEWSRRGTPSDIIYIDRPGAAKNPLSRLLRTRRCLKRTRPDAVLAHSALPNLYARAAALTVRSRPPIVTVLHSAGEDFSDFWLRMAERVLRRVTSEVVAVSQKNAEEYAHRIGGPRPRLIPNAPADDFWADVSPPETLPYDLELIAVGRIAPQKDYPTLIAGVRGAALLLKGRHHVTLSIVGDAVDKNYGRDIRRLGESSTNFVCNFLGASEEVARLLRAAHIFVHAAVAEAAPIVFLEVAATRLPAVVAEAFNFPFNTRQRSAWILFEPGDPPALTSALIRMIDEWETRRSAAPELQSSTPQLEDCARAYLEVLTACASR